MQVGEYYWGYGPGVVVAKVPDRGEFVVAEMTQPFDQGDVTYFFPLMQQTEERLGYRPRYATFDAAFDTWYVYAYFYRENAPSTASRLSLSLRRATTKPNSASSRQPVNPCVPPDWPCRSNSPTPIAPLASWNINAANMCVLCVILN